MTTDMFHLLLTLLGRVPLVEQELLTIPENLSSPPVFSGVRVTRSLVLYVCFVDRCLSFCTFLLAIVLSVLLRYTDSHCPFGIFKTLLMVLNAIFNNILVISWRSVVSLEETEVHRENHGPAACHFWLSHLYFFFHVSLPL